MDLRDTFSDFLFAYHSKKLDIVNKYTYLGDSFASSTFFGNGKYYDLQREYGSGDMLDLLRNSKTNSG